MFEMFMDDHWKAYCSNNTQNKNHIYILKPIRTDYNFSKTILNIHTYIYKYSGRLVVVVINIYVYVNDVTISRILALWLKLKTKNRTQSYES